MVHKSEDSRHLSVQSYPIKHLIDAINATKQNTNEVVLVVLPSISLTTYFQLDKYAELVKQVIEALGSNATLIIIGEAKELCEIHTQISKDINYQLWIAIKKLKIVSEGKNHLPSHHFGAVVYTKYSNSLIHTKTRISYQLCPSCGRTTKDYGGKRHVYPEYGTLMSDVWRDIACDLNGDLNVLFNRFADLFGVERYHKLVVLDCRNYTRIQKISNNILSYKENSEPMHSKLLNGDCIEELKKMPSNSIDFAFADPPYNLHKSYDGYDDDIDSKKYGEWCNVWLDELTRVIKPGRTVAIVNIPIWIIRHYMHLKSNLVFQNWIVWDALSFPVRKIMPAHYPIICFTKGLPRELPGLINSYKISEDYHLSALGEAYCLRADCKIKRNEERVTDIVQLTDIWWDTHRLKHNSRRVDHPCQLPPRLMFRLIKLFTNEDECVLDCFNGAGTTTLCAQITKRRYVGIELSNDYHLLALARHNELDAGLDPFRKEVRNLTSKNSPVQRIEKQHYMIPKKKLQLDIIRITEKLGHIPSRAEAKKYVKYPVKYYDEYFLSWGEACAAARASIVSKK